MTCEKDDNCFFFFLQNCHTCLNRGNCVTSMFNAVPPTLQEYLPLDEDIVPLEEGDDEVELGYTYDYGGKRKNIMQMKKSRSMLILVQFNTMN
jgi:GH15 family glucan-1,4-alpha-glucosidase